MLKKGTEVQKQLVLRKKINSFLSFLFFYFLIFILEYKSLNSLNISILIGLIIKGVLKIKWK